MSLQPISPTDPDVRGGATHSILGRDLVVGDDLYFLAKPYRIMRFEDYSPALVLGRDEPGWRIAYSGGPRWQGDKGWGMTIEPDGRYRIGPRA